MRACLFEAPLERLREEGFSGLAVFVAQLAAIEQEGPSLFETAA